MTEILTLSAASVFYGGSLGDPGDREALISLTRTCLDPKSMSWVQPHTPQYLLATLMPSPGKLQANIHAGVGNIVHCTAVSTGVQITSVPTKA